MVAYTDSLGFNKGTAAYTSNYTNRLSVVELELNSADIDTAKVKIQFAVVNMGADQGSIPSA